MSQGKAIHLQSGVTTFSRPGTCVGKFATLLERPKTPQRSSTKATSRVLTSKENMRIMEEKEKMRLAKETEKEHKRQLAEEKKKVREEQRRLREEEKRKREEQKKEREEEKKMREEEKRQREEEKRKQEEEKRQHEQERRKQMEWEKTRKQEKKHHEEQKTRELKRKHNTPGKRNYATRSQRDSKSGEIAGPHTARIFYRGVTFYKGYMCQAYIWFIHAHIILSYYSTVTWTWIYPALNFVPGWL